MTKTTADIAQGKWLELLPKLGVNPNYLINKHGPCPICGGKDRFRFDNKDGRGSFICNSCGAGDGITLAQLATGKSFKVVAESIAKLLGEAPVLSGKDQGDDLKRREAIKRIWGLAEQPSIGGPVHKFMNRRLNLVWNSKFIREYRSSTHWLMVCKVCGPDDTAQNIHLTYLTEDGHKADITPCRRLMPGPLPDGSAIRLAPADLHMGVAEGIETAISASVLFGIPVWAAINSQNLSKWVPPTVAQHITVFGDHDESFTGHAASYTLAKRLTLQHKLKVDVKIPKILGQDWNDVLLSQ